MHNIKMENNEIKIVCIKNRTCCYFDDIIKLEDFDLDILIDEKSHENILLVQNLCELDSIKEMEL